MSLATIFELVFAAGAVIAVAALAGAGFRLVGRAVLRALTGLLVLMAAAGWAAFALQPGRELAVSAGGLTGAAVAASVSLVLAQALRRAARIDAELDRAEQELTDFVAREVDARNAELERLLARARADSISLLTEQERRIAEERRAHVIEHERAAGVELSEALAQTQ